MCTLVMVFSERLVGWNGAHDRLVPCGPRSKWLGETSAPRTWRVLDRCSHPLLLGSRGFGAFLDPTIQSRLIFTLKSFVLSGWRFTPRHRLSGFQIVSPFCHRRPSVPWQTLLPKPEVKLTLVSRASDKIYPCVVKLLLSRLYFDLFFLPPSSSQSYWWKSYFLCSL
jgi:hypothetical protein